MVTKESFLLITDIYCIMLSHKVFLNIDRYAWFSAASISRKNQLCT